MGIHNHISNHIQLYTSPDGYVVDIKAIKCFPFLILYLAATCSIGGTTAILEFLYFTHFLLDICLGKIVVGLGIASVNLIIALISCLASLVVSKLTNDLV